MPAVPLREEMDDGDVSHPFDLDLDISGERSLHRLLNTAVSLEGMQRLRDWLLTRDLDPEVIRARRALVRELIPLSGFRRKLMTYSLFATRFSTSLVDGERLLDAPVSLLTKPREKEALQSHPPKSFLLLVP